MSNCDNYVSEEDIRALKESEQHIEHVARSRNSSGSKALSVTDTIRGESVTNRTLDGLEELYQNALSNIGYQQMGDYTTGITIDGRNQIVFYDGSWYIYRGDLPHVTTGATLPEDGGIYSDANPDGLWVDIGDASLRGDLLSTNGASLIYTKSGDSVQKRLDVLSSTNELSNIRILTQLPIKTAVHFQIISQYKYTYMYPQGLCFFDGDNELYISWEAVGSASVNSWTWISVYDTTTWEMKCIFSAGVGAAEGLYVHRYDGIKYLVTMQQETSGIGGKTGVYQLPDDIESINLQRLTPVNVAVTNQRYQLTGYKDTVLMEVLTGSQVNRRNSFVFYNFKDLLTETNPKPIGCINLDNSSTSLGKRQGIGWYKGSIITTGGAYFNNALDNYNNAQTVSFRRHLLNGDAIEEFTGSPIDILNKLKPHLVTEPSRLENEGCSFSSISGEVKPYTMLITDSAVASNEAIGGIVVAQLEERSPEAIMLGDTTTPSGYYMAGNYNSIFEESTFDLSSNRNFTTFKDVLDFITEKSIRKYSLYVGSSEIRDLSGDLIENSTLLTFINVNNFTYLCDVRGNLVSYQLLITKSGDTYNQQRHAYVYSSRTNVRDEYLRKPVAVQGVDGYPCTNYYSISDSGTLTTARFFSGDSVKTLSGSIQIDSTNTVTKFNTTSDARLKEDYSSYDKGLQVLEQIDKNEAICNFTWKRTGVKDYGFIAQRLKEVAPKAVSYDQEEDLYYVDHSKLVPDLVSAVITLSRRVQELEGKIDCVK